MVSLYIKPIYSLIIAIAVNRNPISNNNIPTTVPNPSKGTPNLNHLKTWIPKITIDDADKNSAKKVLILSGVNENAKIPRNAKPKTGSVAAWDFPLNLVFLSNSNPVDLNPTHEKNPL